MFTVQQIQEIEKKLAALGKKDSDFKPLDTWSSLGRQDYMAFVKDGVNRSVTIDQLYTYLRQNINADIGDALERVSVLEKTVQDIGNTLSSFMIRTDNRIAIINSSINSINGILEELTARYTVTVNPVTPGATVYINGVEQSSLSVVSGSTVNVRVSAEGYDTYEEFVLVENDITLTPELVQSQVTFTIVANPSDATVRINGAVRRAVTVPVGTLVNWEVSKSGYITQSGQETVEVSYALPVTLQTIGSDSANFTISVVSPAEAEVTINGQKVSTAVVAKGSEVTWSVEAPHYITQSGRENISEDTVKSITLEAEQVTLTISPTPADSTVMLNGVSQSSITVDYNTSVHIKVSKDGYITHEEDYTVTSTETKDITLEEIVETSWTDLVLSQASSSENPIDEVPQTGGNISVKASVTAHFNDGSSQSKDVTSEAEWSVAGEGCSSTGNGVFTWSENTGIEDREATVSASVTGPGSSDLSSSIQTMQLGDEIKLTVSPTELTFYGEGGIQDIQIQSNVSWTII